MLTDEQIDLAEQALTDYRQNDALSKVLDRYGNLLEDYKTLKSEYEEARESRERYKKLSRGQERGEYVVVLIDGDGYVFQDDFVRRGADDGGGNAARALNEAVKATVEAKGLGRCQILIRIYANVAGLSKTLSKAGLCGPEKRSLTPFIADFNRSFGNMDFVDAGELKENADFKLRDQLQHHIKNTQCKHIFFAACHDVGYISELTSHKGNRGKFTLVSSPGVNFHQHFDRLEMNIEGFPGVFRTTPLDTNMPFRAPLLGTTTQAQKAAAQSQLPPATAVAATPSSPAKPESYNNTKFQEICRFFSMGKCTFGNNCKFAHVSYRVNAQPSSRGIHKGSSSVDEGPPNNNWVRQQTQGNEHVHQGVHIKTNGGSPGDLSKLPRKDDIPAGHIAINKNNHRLDAFVPVTATEEAHLQERIKKQQVCNQFQLTGICYYGEGCQFDHEPLHEAAKKALEVWARSLRCNRGGACRDVLCTNGHICQLQSCKHRGGKEYCRLPISCHNEDLAPANMIAPRGRLFSHNSGSSDDGIEDEDGTPLHSESQGV